MSFLERLRAANVLRDSEWVTTNGVFDTMFWVNELGGEAGEASNIFKKLERERLGAVGSRAPLSAAKEELADVIICCDLLGANQQIVFPDACWASWPKLDEEPQYTRYGATLVGLAGRCCTLVVNGNRAPMMLLPIALHNTLSYAKQVGDWLGFDMEAAVVTKFNMTSEKNGLTTMLDL